MHSNDDIDVLIRRALEAEGVSGFDRLAEPSLPDMVTEVFRGRLRWYGAMFLAMILVFSVVAVTCAVRFLATTDVVAMLRWGAGFFLCVIAVMGGKNWYWMQMERLAMIREIKRVELLVAHLSAELRDRR